MSRIVLVAPLALIALSGCQTAASIVTFPVKAVGQGVDWATTSQDEAYRNYGRKMREAEEREGKERRAWEKRCRRDPAREECRGDYPGYRARVERD